ncbi:hypothetical protein LIT25_23925 [Bacillus sp. F19]|nr:hypothetical protein LIT25_23925 [Bacillus sp. F19]
MDKQLLRNAVKTLIKYYKGGTINERGIFLCFLEGLTDIHNQQYYFLGDLQALADVINEREATFLVDEIAKYDYQSAQVLDVLVMKD